MVIGVGAAVDVEVVVVVVASLALPLPHNQLNQPTVSALASGANYFLGDVLTHEMGHMLGLMAVAWLPMPREWRLFRLFVS